MDKKTKNIILWGVLIAFGIGGSFQSFFGTQDQVVAHVGKKAIRASEVRKFMGFIRVPEGINRNDANVQHMIFSQALYLVVEKSLVEQECESLGLVVSDEKVIESIKSNPLFQESGIFSKEKFEAELKKHNLSEMEFKYVQKQNLLYKQWSFLLRSTFKIPEHVVETVAKAFTQKRSGKYTEIDFTKIKIRKPDMKTLEAFFQTHRNAFKIPEKRIVEIVIFPDSKNLEDISSRLKTNEFEALAQEFSGKYYTHDKLGSLPKELGEAIKAKAETLEKGEVSSLYALYEKIWAIRLKEIIPAEIPQFDLIKKTVAEVYTIVEQKKKAKIERNSKWVHLSDLMMNEETIGINPQIVRAIFYHKKGETTRLDAERSIYYVMTEKISKPTVLEPELDQARNFLQKRMMEDITEAAVNSLRLKYKIAW